MPYWHFVLGSPDRKCSTFVIAESLDCARFNASATFGCRPAAVRVLSAIYMP